MMGNAAAAFGALEAGVNLICGYPGTPSSEILETAGGYVREAVATGRLASDQAPHVEWSVNEKAALELAFGASISGARALVTMKQMGLNVACDPLLTIAYLGARGGLVLFVADDPGPISSQTEQDTRQFTQFAHVPLLDAASPEELHAMMRQAFDISERHGTPVIVRATTRVCHGYASIALFDSYAPQSVTGFERDPRWVILPTLATKAHATFPDRFAALVADEEFTSWNRSVPALDTTASVGLVAGGISWAYLLDALDLLGLSGTFGLMKIGAVFPFDDTSSAEFLAQHSRILVFEELEATLERELLRVAGSRQIPVSIFGKLTQSTAYAGENSVERIASELCAFLGEAFVRDGACGVSHAEGPTLETSGSDASDSQATQADDTPTPSQAVIAQTGDTPPPSQAAIAQTGDTPTPSQAAIAGELLVPRPPVLCAGCPHRASFFAVKKAMRGKRATFSGDIGCYTLGNALPLDMVDSCVCMGAGFTVLQGRYWAEPDVAHIGFVGDSTFFASGLTGVVNAVYNRAAVTLIVLDNAATAMTGLQPHPGTGMRMSAGADETDSANAIPIARVLEALGVKHVEVVNPLNLPRAIEAVKTAVAVSQENSEVSALVFKAPCIKVGRRGSPPQVLSNQCNGCRVCINSIGCPALSMDGDAECITINEELCFGCGLCTQLCISEALKFKVSERG